jgi:hypothetical protein
MVTTGIDITFGAVELRSDLKIAVSDEIQQRMLR